MIDRQDDVGGWEHACFQNSGLLIDLNDFTNIDLRFERRHRLQNDATLWPTTTFTYLEHIFSHYVHFVTTNIFNFWQIL